jgi:two-component system chemotaxis sensor kinase CheA
MEIDRKAVLQTFHAETAENLATMQEATLALEKSPDDPEIVATLFRAAHTIKGNSEAVGVPSLTSLAHAAEDVLASLRSRRVAVTSALVTRLLGMHDAMNAALAAAVDDEGPSATRSLRVDVGTLDSIVTALEELVVARGRLEVAIERAADASEALTEIERSFETLRELVMQLRLVDAAAVFRAQARSVRDVASATGKRVRLSVEAEDVEVDTSVADALRDPIMHMVRNSVDHGIEPPDVRIERGKDPVGTITIRARRESGRFVVEVSDDGEGLSRERILAKARASGLVSGDGAELSDEDVFRLVLAPGFSTAETVTNLSGRGVGMDVVARAVRALGGRLELTSTERAGTTVRLRVPLSLSLIDGFTVDAGAETYLLPLESVRECVELRGEASREGDETGILSLRGAALPFVRLRALFGQASVPSGRENVVVVEHEGQRAGLAVDALHGRRQAVMKPVADVLRGSRVITGTTLLGDGRVALVLDVPAILREVAQP